MNGVELNMDKKPIVKPGESVTRVDAGDLQTNREKIWDGLATEDIVPLQAGIRKNYYTIDNTGGHL